MVRQKNLNVRSTCLSAVGGLTHRPIPGMPMIDRFHKDPDTWIFLISTLAGGTGLNLVGANKVVIFGESPRSPLTNRGLLFGQIRIGVRDHVFPSSNWGFIKG
jgi:hypothetical protein